MNAAAPAATADAAAEAGRRRERRIGFACAGAIVCLWTGFILLSRAGLKGNLTPWDLGVLRYTVAFVCVLPLALRHGFGGLPLGRALVLMAAAGFGFGLFAYHGFARAPAAHGGVLLAGSLPFTTAFLAWLLLAEPWTRRRVASLAVVAAGVALLAGPTLAAGTVPGAWRGDLMFVGANLSWALYTVLGRRWRVGAVPATVAICLLAAPIYLPVYLFLLPSNLAAASWAEIAFQGVYQGAIAVVVALVVYTRALVALGPATLTTVTALVPVTAALLAWPLLSEPLAPVQVLGVLLVWAGIVLGVARYRARVDTPRAAT